MGNSAVSYFEASKETEVNKDVFGVLGNQFLDLLEYIFNDDFTGLLLELGQLRDSARVDFDGGEREVDFILHFHAVFNEEFFHQANNQLFRVIFSHQLRGELHWISE